PSFHCLLRASVSPWFKPRLHFASQLRRRTAPALVCVSKRTFFVVSSCTSLPSLPTTFSVFLPVATSARNAVTASALTSATLAPSFFSATASVAVARASFGHSLRKRSALAKTSALVTLPLITT